MAFHVRVLTPSKLLCFDQVFQGFFIPAPRPAKCSCVSLFGVALGDLPNLSQLDTPGSEQPPKGKYIVPIRSTILPIVLNCRCAGAIPTSQKARVRCDVN